MQIQTHINEDTACTATLTHYQPYRPAKTYGEPEDCCDEVPEEIEFTVHVGGEEIGADSLSTQDRERIENELREVSE